MIVSNATISPGFSAGNTSYSANVPFEVSKLELAATAEDANASVNISNPNLIQNATTNVTVTVTAPSGAKKTYTIKVKRARDLNYVESANNNLSSLKIANGELSPAFNTDTITYTTSVPYEVDNLGVEATPVDKLSKISVGNASLAEGTVTDVIITVTAENGSVKTYTIKVTRASYIPGSNNSLSDIQIDKCLLSPQFNSDITRYVVWLPYESDFLDVTGLPSDSKAKVEVFGGANLEPRKDNEIRIVCTSENGTVKEYFVIARRAEAEGSVTESQSQVSNTDNGKKSNDIIWIIIVVGVGCIGIGFGAGFFVLKKKNLSF